jgi:hypothetical protein
MNYRDEDLMFQVPKREGDGVIEKNRKILDNYKSCILHNDFTSLSYFTSIPKVFQ